MDDSLSTRASEALIAAYESARDRMPNIALDAFLAAVNGWEVEPVYVEGSLAGAVLMNGPEIHACILPAYFRRWLSRKVLRNTLQKVVAAHGYALTKVATGNKVGETFVKRLGFKEVSNADGINVYRLGEY